MLNCISQLHTILPQHYNHLQKQQDMDLVGSCGEGAPFCLWLLDWTGSDEFGDQVKTMGSQSRSSNHSWMLCVVLWGTLSHWGADHAVGSVIAKTLQFTLNNVDG